MQCSHIGWVRADYSHPPSSTYFWKRITTDALENHEGTDSIGDKTINNLRFADDIDGLAGEEEELGKLVERLDSLYSLWRGDQYRLDRADDKQYQRHQRRDQSKWTESLRLSQASNTWAQL